MPPVRLPPSRAANANYDEILLDYRHIIIGLTNTSIYG